MNQKRLSWLLEKLQSPDNVERLCTATQLAQIPMKEAALPLIQCLNDTYFSVRLIAARALGQLLDQRAVEPLVACTQNEQESDHVRAAAASSLGDIGDVRAVEPLISCLQNPDEDVHRTQAAAAEALGRLLDRRAVKPLIACLSWELYPWGDVRLQAAKALGHLRDSQAVEPLIAFLQDTIFERNNHEAALLALVELDETNRVVNYLLTELREQPTIRVSVAKALVQWGDDRALAPLSACLQDADPLLRVWVALALESIRERLKEQKDIGDWQKAEGHKQIEAAQVGESLIAALHQLLTPAHVGLWPALQELEDFQRFNLPRITELLLSCLEDPRLEMQETAAWTLAYLDDRRAVEPLSACLKARPLMTCLGKEYPMAVRKRSIHALGHLKDARAIEPLLACLNEAKAIRERGRGEASIIVQALGQLGHAGALEPLLTCLEYEWDDISRSVGVEAARALGMLKDARAVEPLCVHLQDESQEMRAAVARALQQVGDAHAVEPLLACLQDRVPGVQVEAVRALGQIGDARAIAPLRALLHSLNVEGVLPGQIMDLAVRQALFQLEWAQLDENQG